MASAGPEAPVQTLPPTPTAAPNPPPDPRPEGFSPYAPYPGFPGYPPHPAYGVPPGYPPLPYPMGYYPPYPYSPYPAQVAAPDAGGAPPPPFPPPPFPPPPYPHPAFAPHPYPGTPYPPGFPVPAPHAISGYPPSPPQTAADRTVQARNQQLLISGIITAVFLIHLPWLLYLYGVHGCWGSFVEACRTVDVDALELDPLAETPMLFARVTFFMLRVQTVLLVDFAKFSEVLQLSTGLGSFALTKIVAANGMIATGNLRRFALAGTCAVAFVVLFWAELHLTGSNTYAILGDETVLSFIDRELPPDFLAATEARAGLMQYLQILRLADALIFGAALAMPRTPKGV